MIPQVKETMPGLAGNCVSGSAWTIAWATEAVMPWLHIISVVVGILASAGTAGFYFMAWLDGRHKKSRRRPKFKKVNAARKRR